MECLTPTVSFDMFMDHCFASFRLLTHLGIKNIRATGVLNKNKLRKNKLRKCTSIGEKQLQKEERDHIEQHSAHLAKKQCNLCGWLGRHQGVVYIASSESFQT